MNTQPRPTALETWLRMCCETPEFVAQYNRLRGTSLRFELPQRSPIEAMVDQACGNVPSLTNDEGELQEFFRECRDLLLRWPGLDNPANFAESR
jgi:hypothetical protein